MQKNLISKGCIVSRRRRKEILIKKIYYLDKVALFVTNQDPSNQQRSNNICKNGIFIIK